MKSRIYRIIPVEERPYHWATKEMELLQRETTTLNLTDLDKISNGPRVTVSIFCSMDASNKAILRVYWRKLNKVSFTYISNYENMLEQWPELVNYFESVGREQYYAALGVLREKSEEIGEQLYSEALATVVQDYI